MPDCNEIEAKILETFSNVASSIGYSDLHGKIIGVLIVEGPQVSLQDLAEKTGYSPSMISLSLDFLEVLSVIKKIKRSADRKLYVELNGTLLECLKKAVLTKVKKAAKDSFLEFEQSTEALKKLPEKEAKKLEKTINVLEKEIKKLERYIEMLSAVEIP